MNSVTISWATPISTNLFRADRVWLSCEVLQNTGTMSVIDTTWNCMTDGKLTCTWRAKDRKFTEFEIRSCKAKPYVEGARDHRITASVLKRTKLIVSQDGLGKIKTDIFRNCSQTFVCLLFKITHLDLSSLHISQVAVFSPSEIHLIASNSVIRLFRPQKEEGKLPLFCCLGTAYLNQHMRLLSYGTLLIPIIDRACPRSTKTIGRW